MNWPRTIALAVLGLAIATFIIAVGTLIGAILNQRSLDRSVCITETYAPFYQHLAEGLVELDREGGVSPATSDALADDALLLATLNERCPS